MEKSGEHLAGGNMPSPLQIYGAQNLTLRCVTHPRLSLGMRRIFQIEFHTSIIHIFAIILDYVFVLLVALNILLF